MKVNVPFTAAHIAIFMLFAFLCYEAHQVTRYIVSALTCAGYGSMTFTEMVPRQPCSHPTLLMLSGPLVTNLLAYLGMFLLWSRKYRLLGYNLVFASFVPIRFIQTLTGRGDEELLAQQISPAASRPLVALIVLLIALPPVIAAYLAVANRRRLWTVLASILLLFPVLVVLLFGDGFLFGANNFQLSSVKIGAQVPAFLGISLIVWIVDLAAVVLFVVFAPRLMRAREEV